MLDFYEQLFVRERTSDFWEMNLHHVITISLFTSMILINMLPLGCFVSFLHNMSDILLILARLLSNTVYKISCYITMFLAIIVWFVMRNVALPYVTHESWKGHIFTG